MQLCYFYLLFSSILCRSETHHFLSFRCSPTADNIGFEDPSGLTSSASTGVLKVFDFDVARILPEEDVSKSTLPLFQLTKRVGSPRYMSPECARGDAYNEKADVYSFGIVLWECFQAYFQRYSSPKVSLFMNVIPR